MYTCPESVHYIYCTLQLSAGQCCGISPRPLYHLSGLGHALCGLGRCGALEGVREHRVNITIVSKLLSHQEGDIAALLRIQAEGWSYRQTCDGWALGTHTQTKLSCLSSSLMVRALVLASSPNPRAVILGEGG